MENEFRYCPECGNTNTQLSKQARQNDANELKMGMTSEEINVADQERINKNHKLKLRAQIKAHEGNTDKKGYVSPPGFRIWEVKTLKERFTAYAIRDNGDNTYTSYINQESFSGIDTRHSMQMI
jgi:hypothetical protein